MRLIDLAEWNPPENFQCCRSRDREGAMRAFDGSVALIELGDKYLFNSQRFHADTCADNIRNGIQRADLVKLDIFRGLTVDLSLGHSDPLKDAERVFFDKGRKLTGLNQSANSAMGHPVRVRVAVVMGVVVRISVSVRVAVVIMSMRSIGSIMSMLVLMRVRVRGFAVDGPGMNPELDPFHALAMGPLKVHVKIADLQLGKFPLEGGWFHAQIAEGTDSHIAANARGRAVKEENAHGELGAGVSGSLGGMPPTPEG